jgi:hypothetical protein
VLAGDLLRKQEAEGAIEAFLKSGSDIEKLEEGFVQADNTLPTYVILKLIDWNVRLDSMGRFELKHRPRKPSAAVVSSPSVSRKAKDHLLPGVLAHVLRQRILLSADGAKGDKGDGKEADMEDLLKRISSLSGGAHTVSALLSHLSTPLEHTRVADSRIR